MQNKVTKCTPPYPIGYEPDFIIPATYCEYRYALGKCGTNPLVVICMNPSAAKEETSDKTINRIINVSKKLGNDGWVVFNIYPERATNAQDISDFDEKIMYENLEVIKAFLLKNKISEVWGAWGDDKKIKALQKGKDGILSMLANINVKVFYYGTLTKAKNPRHPLQRYEKVDFLVENKNIYTEHLL